MSSDQRPPAFDEIVAGSHVGKYILVGLTYEDSDGVAYEQKQMHGRITSVHPKRGFCIKLGGDHSGEEYWLPPDMRYFKDAPKGEFRLRSTGEIVVDPDLLSNWVVTKDPEMS